MIVTLIVSAASTFSYLCGVILGMVSGHIIKFVLTLASYS